MKNEFAEKEDYLIIEPHRVSNVALESLIEEYILREGTDYGHAEPTLEDKKKKIKKQLETKKILIVFSQLTQDTSLILSSSLQQKDISAT